MSDTAGSPTPGRLRRAGSLTGGAMDAAALGIGKPRARRISNLMHSMDADAYEASKSLDELLRTSFALIDQNEDGFITEIEGKRFGIAMYDDANEARHWWTQLIKLGDYDGDGKISRRDWERYMREQYLKGKDEKAAAQVLNFIVDKLEKSPPKQTFTGAASFYERLVSQPVPVESLPWVKAEKERAEHFNANSPKSNRTRSPSSPSRSPSPQQRARSPA